MTPMAKRRWRRVVSRCTGKIGSLVGLLRDARGFTLLEAVVTSAVFMTIVFGMMTLYTTSQQAYNYGTSQAYLQRVGTLLQERIQRELVGSIALQTVDCGPNSTANLSVMAGCILITAMESLNQRSVGMMRLAPPRKSTGSCTRSR